MELPSGAARVAMRGCDDLGGCQSARLQAALQRVDAAVWGRRVCTRWCVCARRHLAELLVGLKQCGGRQSKAVGKWAKLRIWRGKWEYGLYNLRAQI